VLERGLWRDFVAVTCSVAILGIGVGSTVPLTALVLTARGHGPQLVGAMVAISAAGGVLGTLLSPAASRVFGRRKVMMTSVVLASASVIGLQSADGLLAWAALRLLFGACMAPLFVLGESWISTLPSDAVRGRVVGIYSTAFTLCQVLGPLLTAALAGMPDHVFTICGAVFLLGLPGLALARDDGPGSTRSAATASVASSEAVKAPAKEAAASWLRIATSAPTLLVGAGLFAAFDAIILSFLPLFCLDHGLTPQRALGAVVIVFIGDTTLQIAAGYLADRFGRARIQRLSGMALCVLLPLMPWTVGIPFLWQLYLYVLGGVAGSIYTLSMISSGERFSGAALIRASGLIALTWNLASSLGPMATGLLMQHAGSKSMTAVLWLMALGFVLTTWLERRHASPTF
jgi:MFS family permease